MDISEDSEPQQAQEQQPQQVQWDVNTGSNSNEIDIDSSLLQQFSCLGTTDHEDLINDFQRLLANQINKDTARFFLEMSNWNLQTAACCYLDFCNFQNLPSMKIVNIRQSESSHIWKLQNNGDEDWPNGCYLMSPSQSKRIDVPSIGAGHTCDVVVSITRQGPPVMWRLCTPNGRYFGDTIWMNLPETSDEAADLAERMSQLRTTPMSVDNSPSMNVVIFVNLD